MNMRVLKRSRSQTKPGDFFAFQMCDRDFGFGRVISTNATIGGLGEVNLLYLYNCFSPDKLNPPLLTPQELLLPPLGVDRHPWTRGYFETIEHRPLAPSDVLPVHCFRDPMTDQYVDEFGNPLAGKTEPCGFFLLDSYNTLDVRISMALGIEPDPDTLPPPKREPSAALRKAREEYGID